MTAAVENADQWYRRDEETRLPTRECADAKEIETGLGDGLRRVWDENGACNSDDRSHDRCKVEDPLPRCILNEQGTDDQSQNC